jgi:hypothetical protein
MTDQTDACLDLQGDGLHWNAEFLRIRAHEQRRESRPGEGAEWEKAFACGVISSLLRESESDAAPPKRNKVPMPGKAARWKKFFPLTGRRLYLPATGKQQRRRST